MEYKYKTTKLKNLFYKDNQSCTYLIPYYQREFCWEKSNLKIFLFQLKNSLEKAEESYFLGLILFQDLESNKIKNKFQIIDGQQRLVVFSLFMICFYLFFKEQKDTDESKTNMEYIQNCIFNSDLSKKLILKFNDFHEDGDTYKDITDFISNDLEKKSVENWIKNNKQNKTQIFQGFKFVWESFKEKWSEPNKIKNYFKIFQGIEVIAIKIKKSFYNPQIIFESLNSTGKSLNLVQLIKNYILMPFNAEDKEIIQTIKNWETNLNVLHKKTLEPFEEFLYVYIHILQEEKFKLSKKFANQSLYWAFRKDLPEFLNEKKDAWKIFESLSKNIYIFCCLFSLKGRKKNLKFKKCYENKLKENVKLLFLISNKGGCFHLSSFGSEFKILLHFFTLLAYQEKIKTNTYVECISALSALELFLRITKESIGQLSATYSKFFKKKTSSESIKNILLFKTDKNNWDEIVKGETKKFLNEKIDKNSFFSDKCVDSKKLFQFMEEKLKRKTPGKSKLLNKSILEFLLAISENNEFKETKFNLEHINSQESSNKKKSKEIFELGNLILLEEEINQNAGISSFEEKKEKYKESKNIDIENFIKDNVKKEKWDSDSIELRTEKKWLEFTEEIKKVFEKWLF